MRTGVPRRPTRGAAAVPTPPRHAWLLAALVLLMLPAPARVGVALDPAPPAGSPAGDPRPVVVVDPGHGGADPGAVAVDGGLEKDLVLAVALELARALERTGRYRVALTRAGDAFVRLPERVARARAAGGRLLVSLHADSLPVAGRRGAAVYTLAEETGPVAAYLPGGGAPPGRGGVVAVAAPVGLAPARRGGVGGRAGAFADLVADELGGVTPMLPRRRRTAGFAVLRSPDLPSVLMELGCLSNAEDARALGQAEHRAALARAILRALDRYFAFPWA